MHEKRFRTRTKDTNPASELETKQEESYRNVPVRRRAPPLPPRLPPRAPREGMIPTRFRQDGADTWLTLEQITDRNDLSEEAERHPYNHSRCTRIPRIQDVTHANFGHSESHKRRGAIAN